MASTSSSSNSDIEPTSSVAPTPATTESSAGLAPLKLDVKFVDSRWEEESDSWKYNDTTNPDVPAEQVQPVGTETTGSDDWEEFCFVVVRKHSKSQEKSQRTITFEIVLKSPYLVQACQDVIGDVRSISWNSEPIKLDPKMLITYMPRFEEHERELSSRTVRTEEDDRVLKSLGVLLAYLRKNYKQTLARIASLTKNHEITFDLLYAVLIPGTIVIRRCPVTRETRAMKLLRAEKYVNNCGQEYWQLECDGLECAADEDGEDEDDVGWNDDESKRSRRFGMSETTSQIRWFPGVEKINTLSVFPIEYHPDPSALKAVLLERARRWVSLCGVHHVHYKGTAARHEWVSGDLKLKRYGIRSRVMIDKAGLSRVDADYELPIPDRLFPERPNDNGVYGLTDDELLLASPILYGFSLTDKLWLEYNVNLVTPIIWNDEAFAGLVLPPERKTLLRSLIEAHKRLNSGGAGGFDDFVRGKGQGLVINLFGPPGVGKTLSAEATSEHLRRPLYIVGSGDLGTTAHELDRALDEAFDLAAAWNAVLLIDEADVFLEQRSLHDMERNAMVAVFLRHIEYYRGILFLTTNRIKTFDEAFLSRIHVALHFNELTVPTKVQIWRAFLRKAGLDQAELSEELLTKLAQRDINGRQIKNACRTATSLAISRGEQMRYEHLAEALNAMEEFMTEFAAISQAND
ncbi:P-loop containing nucleoside triphosphate hydrolase protein [Dichomitus squalens]|uniref:P-loop containing nucleoside triphosphate hydrolase protein n=1 Tax=Dichomitus squalens TaxID=114155 RepID=A0A4Q9PAH1_9APHY|nr:P-loop containing nucleoside triphosphate hydrolase protein [Dichomitus squalens]